MEPTLVTGRIVRAEIRVERTVYEALYSSSHDGMNEIYGQTSRGSGNATSRCIIRSTLSCL